METKGSEFPPQQNYTAKVREAPECGGDFLYLVLQTFFFNNSNTETTDTDKLDYI